MNKLYPILFVFFILVSTSVEAQKEEPTNDIVTFQSAFGFHYIDTNEHVKCIITFKGDSITTHEEYPFFEVDNKIISVSTYPYQEYQFNNTMDTEKLKDLLLSKRDYEADYMEEEIYKNELDIKQEFFTNKEGKLFLLWHYSVPEQFIAKQNADGFVGSHAIHNAYMMFVSNDVVTGISLQILDGMEVAPAVEYLKDTANYVDVFGMPIDVNGYYYKVMYQEQNEMLVYHDSINKYQVKIPEWYNIGLPSVANSFAGTLPDYNNIKNVILITAFPKDGGKYKSLAELNNVFITGNTFGEPALYNQNITFMGKKEMDKPANCNGLAYKVYSKLGNMIYENQFTTYESDTAYIMVMFVATKETFDRNKPRLDEFLANFMLLP